MHIYLNVYLASLARLRGIQPCLVKDTAIQLLEKVGLPSRDFHRTCGTYSGGNRRKLAVAVALVSKSVVVTQVSHSAMNYEWQPDLLLPLSPAYPGFCHTLSASASLPDPQVGDPCVILLDEPSTGMDPGARRQFWGLVQSELSLQRVCC